MRNDNVNHPSHYTSGPFECIELTADTSFCLGNAIKYLWRYHSKGRPVEDLEKARWYLCHVIDHDEKIAWTRQQHAILDTLANDPAIPDAEAHTWAKLRQGFPYSALACLDRLIANFGRGRPWGAGAAALGIGLVAYAVAGRVKVPPLVIVSQARPLAASSCSGGSTCGRYAL